MNVTVPCVCCICSSLQISASFKSFGMSDRDESRNVLVVPFEGSTEPVKVCVCVCVHVLCVCVCVCMRIECTHLGVSNCERNVDS